MKAATVILLLQILGHALCSPQPEPRVVIAGQTQYPVKAENVALCGKATQSSLYYDEWSAFGAADHGNDGNTAANFALGSCTRTALETNPWWRVDLLKRYQVQSVSITNREDCCADRINGAEIRIGDSLENNGNNNPLCTIISTIAAGQTMTFYCASGVMVGRYVNVIIPGENKILMLCEVQVNSSPVSVVAENSHYYVGDVGRHSTLTIGRDWS